MIETLALNGIFDDCIATRLQLSVRQHANHKTRELASLPEFGIRRDSCSVCGAAKLGKGFSLCFRSHQMLIGLLRSRHGSWTVPGDVRELLDLGK